MARNYAGGSLAARFLQSRAMNDEGIAATGSGGSRLQSCDEQKTDMRRGASGVSEHMTAKPFICGWDVLCKSSVRAAKVTCLTSGKSL